HRGEGRAVREERRDVLENDAGLGEVGDVADERPHLLEDPVAHGPLPTPGLRLALWLALLAGGARGPLTLRPAPGRARGPAAHRGEPRRLALRTVPRPAFAEPGTRRPLRRAGADLLEAGLPFLQHRQDRRGHEDRRVRPG